jgi:hypothetical protein
LKECNLKYLKLSFCAIVKPKEANGGLDKRSLIIIISLSLLQSLYFPFYFLCCVDEKIKKIIVQSLKQYLKAKRMTLSDYKQQFPKETKSLLKLKK